MTAFSDRVSNRSRGAAVGFDLTQFVDQVANRFERSKRGAVRVSPAARLQFVESMKPHENELRHDLVTGKMTISELGSILRGVLGVANRSAASGSFAMKRRAARSRYRLGDALRQSRIDRRSVQTAMKLKCRYLGWC
jgi:hypothetical protein